MTRFRTMTSVALVAGLAAAPALADQHQSSQQQNTRQQNSAQAAQPHGGGQLSAEGRACLDRLEQVDNQLADMGYGRAGPQGFGAYGTGYRATAAEARDDGTGALDRPLRVTPRADMYALMRAGYVMARTGHAEGCQQVAAAAENLGDRYEAAISREDFDRAGMDAWRGEMLANATPVTGLDRPLRAEQIIGADLRNGQDRDFGDVSDVVIGPEGRIHYVIVQTGGFLGLGEEAVPVRWNDLKVSAAPYGETFVLEVDEQTFAEAPRLEGTARSQLVSGQPGREVDSFWDSNLDSEG